LLWHGFIAYIKMLALISIFGQCFYSASLFR
jgi:hypothetical protein